MPGLSRRWVCRKVVIALIRRINELFIVAGLLIGVTVLIWITDGDRSLAALFYEASAGWYGVDSMVCSLVYHLAPWPAICLITAALAVLIAGIKKVTLRSLRIHALFILLLLIIGPGLVVNVWLKDNHGRARPREVVEFGGTHEFKQFWEGGDTGKNSSFPSGHASIAFALFAPWFILRDRHPTMARNALIAGVCWGTIVGLVRIAQGGHFLSDVIWAGGLVYLIGGTLALFYSFGDCRLTDST